MIGLDTNVLVRYLTQDDPAQAELASLEIERLTVDDPGFLCVVALVETYWVLRHSYGYQPKDVLSALAGVVSADEIVVESPTLVRRALQAATAGADLGDSLIAAAARHAGCADVVSFDRRAATQLGFRLLA